MDIPSSLVQAIAEGRAVLFIGAGLSQGAGLPGWAALLAPLADEIGLPTERRGDLLQVAQWCESRLGRQALIDHVCRATDCAGIEPTANHGRLLRLPIDTWITTNYDGLLERTLDRASIPCVKVVRDQDLPYTHPDAVTLLKLHGDRRDEGVWLGNLGSAYRDLGEVDQAIEYYERALAIARKIGDRQGEAIRSWNLGLLYEETDPARAVDLMSVRVAYEREIGHPDAEAHAERVEAIRRRTKA
jgi:tetratricopeptide (TPR) repeat protein